MRDAPRHGWRDAQRCAAAFTLVELLAVIAIIGLLVALLLPAVQTAREGGRRASCANKIRQLSQAVLGFESASGTFPPSIMESGLGTTGSVSGSAGTWVSTVYTPPAATRQWCITNMSGLVFLLPHIEQVALYDRANMNAAFGDWFDSAYNSNLSPPRGLCGPTSANDAFNLTRVPTFECPTATAPNNNPTGVPAAQADPTRFISYQGRGRTTNYHFVVSQIGWSDGWRRVQPARSLRRLFGEESFARAGMVLDGLSNVLMLGETTSANGSPLGHAWAFSGNAAMGIFYVNMMNLWAVPLQPGRLHSALDPGSEHPGGCHFSFADGSVRFVSENTNGTVLANLSLIADGISPIDRVQ